MFAGTEEYVAIEFKARVNAAAAWQLVHGVRPHLEFPLILIAAETTADARRILTEHGIAFIDGLGNVHLELPGLLFHIGGTGRPIRPPAPSRLSGKAGLIAQALPLDPEGHGESRTWQSRPASRLALLTVCCHRLDTSPLGVLMKFGFALMTSSSGAANVRSPASISRALAQKCRAASGFLGSSEKMAPLHR